MHFTVALFVEAGTPQKFQRAAEVTFTTSNQGRETIAIGASSARIDGIRLGSATRSKP